jgi:competence ComEA-like helix-hairpin-helix protein
VEIEAEEQAPTPERLDLNQAALIELERVPGIGFVRAQALLVYRETHGPLNSIDDLKNVPGFEAETLAQIQDKVLVVAPAGSEEIPVDAHQLALIQARNALAEGDRCTGSLH